MCICVRTHVRNRVQSNVSGGFAVVGVVPVPAIPTTYAGVNFRSRLEARWAAMFDLLGWKWEYEPLDLDGYIPDFVLGFERPMLVEIKPATVPSECIDACEKIRLVASAWLCGGSQTLKRTLAGLREKEPEAADRLTGATPEDVCASWDGWTRGRVRDAVVFGSRLMSDRLRSGSEEECFGVITDDGFAGEEWTGCQIRECICGWTLTTARGSWSCKRGCEGQPGRTGHVHAPEVIAFWREAGNRVQWKPSRR